jgi:hypothetical protein
MKTLLISLLFCVSVITQAQVETDTIFTVDEYGNRIDTTVYFRGNSDVYKLSDIIDTTHWWIVKYKPSEIPVTLQDFFDYEEECYNDSTLVQIMVMKRSKYQSHPGDNNTEIDYIQTPYPYRYDHKKPTFEGFIAYLRKWYKNYMK